MGALFLWLSRIGKYCQFRKIIQQGFLETTPYVCELMSCAKNNRH